ncbi:MAG TPA: DNA replication/repair protein RecF [Rhabdochlamydiaceae bacterium]|jgi:DNA replication and repair protein RecF
MHIEYLKLQNFRNYVDAELCFSPEINLFWGNNGQGKTNLLEAIHLLSTGRSFRTRRMQDMIREGADYFYLEAHFKKDDVAQVLKIYCDSSSKKILHNDTPYSHFSNLLGILPSVLLSPDDHALINGSPAERRRFLDLHLAQIDPLYLFYLSRYYKAMKQRNELLRSKAGETLTSWEQVMAPAAHYLMDKRQQIACSLQEFSSPWMKLFSYEREEIGLAYSSSIANADNLMAYWQKMRAKEMQYGATLAGPHRDDLTIKLCGKEAKLFFSEGQKRSCIASLRFAQWEQMKQFLGSAPLLAIDDFGIQLDAERQRHLQEHLSRFSQVFLTFPHLLDQNFPFHAFHVQEGSINNGARIDL